MWTSWPSLVHELMALYEPDACFLLAEFEGDVQIIARSTTDAIDVGACCAALGAAAMTKAAAGLRRASDLDDVRARSAGRLWPIHDHAGRARAPDHVDQRAHSEADTTIREAAQLMRATGTRAFPW
jgi:hypothetical protein